MLNQKVGATSPADLQTPIESAVKDLARTQRELHAVVEHLAQRLAPVLTEVMPKADPSNSTGRGLGASPLLEQLFQSTDASVTTLDLVNSLHARLTL